MKNIQNVIKNTVLKTETEINSELVKAFQIYEQVLEGYTIWNPPASVQNINPNKDLEWYEASVACIKTVIIPMLHKVLKEHDLSSLDWNLVSKPVLVTFMNHYFSDKIRRTVPLTPLFKAILTSVNPSHEFTELCGCVDYYHKWSLLMLCCHRKNAMSSVCKLLIQKHNVSVNVLGGESNLQTIFHMLAQRCTSDNPTVTDLDRARFFDKFYTCIKYSTDRSVLLKCDKNNQTFLDILNKEESKHVTTRDYAIEYIKAIQITV
jgi:hypothetical protein